MSTQAASRLLNDGYAREQAGDVIGATNRYHSVLEETSEDPNVPMLACLNLGNIELNRGDPERALEWYQKAADFNPDNDAPYFNIANVLRDQGQSSEAIRYFNIAVEKSPTDPAVRRNLALLYAKLGEMAQAVSHLEECVKWSNGEDAVDHYNLGVFRLRTGNELGAYFSFEQYLRDTPAGHEDLKLSARQMMRRIVSLSSGNAD